MNGNAITVFPFFLLFNYLLEYTKTIAAPVESRLLFI